MAESQITSVDDIAQDDKRLQEKATELAGETLTIDSKETVGSDFQIMDTTVGAVLVRKQGAHGAFRVTGAGRPKEVPNVVTGPGESGFVIVIIKPGQTGMCLGHPSIRLFFRETRPSS
ncbi:hypothetical protein K469DRAFT_712409 [Zopfia rhizophila CBS 207.26]|uniref:Uncharacterized protein n=1 Tax=Zopfia rhizophila CBS 207.26 TaxID=1314779 RepID=A0A6A6ES73_9PEZI|nr:hypothetical protein K469DRAFT_712409 [Zopfia rhizophila CBS 207.26]